MLEFVWVFLTLRIVLFLRCVSVLFFPSVYICVYADRFFVHGANRTILAILDLARQQQWGLSETNRVSKAINRRLITDHSAVQAGSILSHISSAAPSFKHWPCRFCVYGRFIVCGRIRSTQPFRAISHHERWLDLSSPNGRARSAMHSTFYGVNLIAHNFDRVFFADMRTSGGHKHTVWLINPNTG